MGWSLLSLFNRRSAAPNPWLRGGSPLTGSFELRVDRIVGQATDNQGATADSMVIEVMRRGRVIASCPATRHPHQPRFDFSLPIEGRFTAKELVIESVIVIARDSSGNRGHLRFDGATQLELLREHFGVPADVILDLDFSRDGNARPYLGAGWYWTGPDSTWTENLDSFISFDTPAEPGTYALRFTAGAFVAKPEPSRQVLDVFVDARQIDGFRFTEGHAQFRECKFSHEVFTASPRTTLRFHHPDAARPSDIVGNKDTRCLAFYFKRLTLVRLLQPE
jgi:hypothetical protein